MEFAVGRMYIENFFDKESKKAVLFFKKSMNIHQIINQFFCLKAYEMILNIQREFKVMLHEYDWMDSESRKAAIEKVFFFFPDFNL